MAEPISPDSNGSRKAKNQTRIAHISDLHFTSTTEFTHDDIWRALSADLQTSQADLLVVTGDLIDSSVRDNISKESLSRAFANVKEFLLSLCGELKIDPKTRLAVVPGNHDYRLKGVISSHSRFPVVGKVKRRFLKPHYDLFYQSFGDYFQARLLPELRCCIFTFDSNTTDLGLNLASGRITNIDLVDFLDLCRRWSTENLDDWRECSKIALVHHHPMPIAATELRGGFIESDAYHLLKNAGLFMTEMVSQGVDLILHGHKHYPAISQAKFPTPGTSPHTVSVIAAGSASKTGYPHSSYNLVTIFDGGGLTVERRIREFASYKSGGSYSELPRYEQTRAALFKRLSQQRLVTVEKYTRIDSIQTGSGDDEITERYRGMRTLAEKPAPLLSNSFSSSSGFVSRPRFESSTHQISWEPDEDTLGKGNIRFDPPIGRSPMDFVSRVNILNAMHFNQQDRLAVGTVPEESAYIRITLACELFVFKVRFPATFSAKQPKVHVLTREGERDLQEEEYASSRFTNFTDDKTAVLIVDHPLPGYVYKIVWGLPETEDEEVRLDDDERLWRDAIRLRLLNLQSVEKAFTAHHVLEALRKTVNDATANSKQVGAKDLEVFLHVYDPSQKGLICVGALADDPARTRVLKNLILVGVNTIGQAYRRREPVKWIRGQNQGQDDARFFDFDPAQPLSCILSIPLLFPLNTGARVGVLTLATRDNTAPMIRLLARSRSDEDRAAFQVLVGQATAWYANDLMAALELQALSISTPDGQT